jgi:predicted nucleic acid-binding protein
VTEELYCFDTSAVILALTVEEPLDVSAATERLLNRAASSGRLVAPAWAWAETGTALRGKVRQRLLTEAEAEILWLNFCELPIEYVQSPDLQARSWETAQRYNLLTLYDAGYLAGVEIQNLSGLSTAEYWTADARFIRDLGSARPPYVHMVDELRGR